MTAQFTIIDNKKVSMTHDEIEQYKAIVKSYTTPPYQKGEDFFQDLFETDEDGIIIFLRPPSKKLISLEIFLFCMSLMQHQHLRKAEQQIAAAVKRLDDKLAEMSKE